MTATLFMKKGNRKIIFMFFVIVILAASCKKASDSSGVIGDITSQIVYVRESAAEAINNTAAAIPQLPQDQQAVYAPQEQQSSYGNDAIAKSYRSPCILQKYRFLNSYCGVKNYWGKQSTLLSWYLPYWLILGMLFLAMLFFIWWLWSRGGG